MSKYLVRGGRIVENSLANQHIANMLSDGINLTPAGVGLATWLAQNVDKFSSESSIARHYQVMVLEGSIEPAAYFVTFADYAARLWQAFLAALPVEKVAPKQESVSINTPKMVSGGKLTPAGMALAEYLSTRYKEGKLEATPEARAYVAFCEVMRQSPHEFMKRNPTMIPALYRLALKGMQKDISEFRAELESIRHELA